MLQTLALFSFLAAQPPALASLPDTPEQLAVGAMLEVLSAEAVHRKNYPDVGYGCSLERLVETRMLLDVWLAGKRVEGYAFKVWCDVKASPQTTFRAAAVPLKKAKGASLTVCSDQTNVARALEGDATSCFEKGTPVK